MRPTTAGIALVIASGLSSATGQTIKLSPGSPQGDAQFGLSVAACGTGPGFLDRDNALVGSPFQDVGGVEDAGRVGMYDWASGALVRTIQPPHKQEGAWFGWSMARLGGFGAEPATRVIVGAPGANPGPYARDAGRAYVFDGETGAMVRAVKAPEEWATAYFGWAVAAVPDVDGDGWTDFAVSAPGEVVMRPWNGGLQKLDYGRGRVHIYSGKTGVWISSCATPMYDETMLPVYAEIENLSFGLSIAGVPDATGDGKGDLLVGAPYADPGATKEDAGRAFLFNGATGKLVKIFKSPKMTVGGRFGMSVTALRDIDGDGRGDVVIGAPWDRPIGEMTKAGRVYIYSGGTGKLLRTLLPTKAEGIGSAEFGAAVAVMPVTHFLQSGDRLAVGAPGEWVNGAPQAGRVYVFNVKNGKLLRQMTSPHAEVGGRFGEAVAGLRDGVGNGDPVVGASREDPGNVPAESGRAYISRD